MVLRNWDYANEIVERERERDSNFFDIVDSFAIKGTSHFLILVVCIFISIQNLR